MTREKGYHWDAPFTASALQPADPTCKRKARAFAPQSKTSLNWDTCLRRAEVSLLRLNAFGPKVCGKSEANKTSNTVLGFTTCTVIYRLLGRTPHPVMVV